MRMLDELKRDVFFRFIELVGRVYIHVRYSDSVILGRRGFVGEERNKGLVLVLNSKMNLTWDDDGIRTTLLFGSAPEKCFIPADDVIAVYSPELGAQFMVYSPTETEKPGKDDKRHEIVDKIIKVDFSKGKH